ncbi:MAG: deoxyribose-phosphate aldolase [Rikenellaceae bacterium]
MDYTVALENNPKITDEQINDILSQAQTLSLKNQNVDVYKKCFSYIDLTTLSSRDSQSSVEAFVTKAVEFPIHFPDVDNVASVCVYPPFVEVAGLAIGGSNMAITSVSGGFPSSQTFIEVKMLETSMAVENGADEIDIVISIGEFLNGEYELVASEVECIKDEIGDDAVLKVILETGELQDANLIYKASMLAMYAGADFIKTSTGKVAVSATPEAAAVMCLAIKDYYNITGKKIGFKAAGGVATAADAAYYYSIVETVLGSEWLNAKYFRIGASSLASKLLSAIKGEQITYF